MYATRYLGYQSCLQAGDTECGPKGANCFMTDNILPIRPHRKRKPDALRVGALEWQMGSAESCQVWGKLPRDVSSCVAMPCGGVHVKCV